MFTKLNVPSRVEPSRLTVTMIATEIPAAIRPYSIAVAPDSSLTNLERNFIIEFPAKLLVMTRISVELVANVATMNKNLFKKLG